MAITTANELRTAIQNWTNDTSANIVTTDRCNEFISLAEARFNRDIRVRAMEQTLPSTALSSGAVSLPTGFLAFKELRYDASPGWTLEPKPLEWIRNRNEGGDSSDKPRFFAINRTQVVCSGQSGSIEGTYYKSLDTLTSNSSNWLLTSHPDLYLAACLEEAATYLRDFEFAGYWGRRAQAVIDMLNNSDMANSISGGLLTARAR